MTVPLHVFSHFHTDMGEKVYAQKFCSTLRVPYICYDIPSLLGSDYNVLAHLNLNLAEEGYTPCISGFHNRLTSPKGRSIVLSWSSGLAALYATGLLEQVPIIAKLYVHQPEERLLVSLYQSVNLIITESLLASQRAQECSLPQPLYIPHHFVHAHPTPDPTYLPRLAQRLNKPLPTHSVAIGTISRLEYWKNPEFAIESVRQIAQRRSIVFVLKGDFPQQSVYPNYETRLQEMISHYSQEPWFFWDRSWTPYPEVLSEYACLDLFVQPSGAEGASNLIVDLLAMGKPVIALEASTNPYLFRGGVLFTPPEPELQIAQLHYARPQLDPLVQGIERLCNARERETLGQQARRIAHNRFHPSHSAERIARMTESTYTTQELEELAKEDQMRYDLD